MNKVQSMDRDGLNGWEFSVSDGRVTKNYRTDSQGFGLYEFVESIGAFVPVIGKFQFNLPANGREARKLTTRFFRDRVL